MTMTKQGLKEYIAMVLEQVILEDFEDSTRPQTNNPKARPQQQQQGQQNQPQQTQAEFSLEQLRKIPNLQQIHSYVWATLEKSMIGEGQGRAVFRLGNGQVLKVAKDAGGIGQNQAEATVCSVPGSNALFPKVAESGPNHMWLVTQEAQPMTEQAFQQLTGLPWGTFVSAMKGAFQGKLNTTKINPQELQNAKQNYINASNNQFFVTILRIIQGCHYEPGDLTKLDSWGVVNGKPVVIDSGFTEAVNQAYYQKSDGASSAAAPAAQLPSTAPMKKQ